MAGISGASEGHQKWGGGQIVSMGGGLDQKSGGVSTWPKVVFLFLVQGE